MLNLFITKTIFFVLSIVESFLTDSILGITEEIVDSLVDGLQLSAELGIVDRLGVLLDILDQLTELVDFATMDVDALLNKAVAGWTIYNTKNNVSFLPKGAV